MPSGDYRMINDTKERAEHREHEWITAHQSQVAFTSELVDAIRELSLKNLELQSEVSELKVKLESILHAEQEKSAKELLRIAYNEREQKITEQFFYGEGCKCKACNPQMNGKVMFLCEKCGNKRCPHATDHTYACTNSNESGQEGSAY